MLKIFKKKINKKWAVLVMVVLGLFLKIKTANAIGFLALGGIAASIIAYFWGADIASLSLAALIGGLASFFSWLVGLISIVFTSILLAVVEYNGFINEEVVMLGWPIVRDLCNMFFVLVLLIIAFATILRIETYNLKKTLPKLLIMAILINFSRTICGLAIDFSQIIMMTFVDAFANAGAGNLYDAFGIQKLFSWETIGDSLEESSIDKNTGFAVVGSIVVGLILLIIFTVVIAIYTIVLIFRIIMLWILIILSPLAFIAMAFPAATKYAQQWTNEFTKYVIIGPVMAFFLWLALSMSAPIALNIGGADGKINQALGTGSEVTEPANMKQFMVSTLFLLAALMMAQQAGVAGGSMAGSAVGRIKGWGIGAAKLAGGAAAYLPKEYGKRAGYDVADRTLGAVKNWPVIGGVAVKKQAELDMHRKYEEEKAARYIKYVPEPDLDRIIQNYSGKGRTRAGRALSYLSRGQEASKQGYRRALAEKAQRGDEYGMTKEEKIKNKTQLLINLSGVAGHSVTDSGEDAFRDAELGKQWHEFRNKNVGMIDDDMMRKHYTTIPGSMRAGKHHSEYFRARPEVKDAQGNVISPALPNGPGMLAYTAGRQKMPEIFNLHHENFAPRIDDAGVPHYDVLDAIYNNGYGTMKSLAQVRDRGTAESKEGELEWMRHRRDVVKDPGFMYKKDFKDEKGDLETYTDSQGHVQEKREGKPVSDADLASNSEYTIIGRSRMITGGTESPEIASGITGLKKNKLEERGILAVPFSDVGLDNQASGKYFKGAEKAEMAGRIGNLLRNDGMAENLAKAVEDQINQASHLILRNKGAGISFGESRTAHAHELLHARMDSTFTDDELRDVWDNSINAEGRGKAREQVKSAGWNTDDMDDDSIMHEYFTEGLTQKTRWGKEFVKKHPDKKVALDNKAEEGLENLLKSKGSNIQAFTSNINETRPTKNNIRQTMAGAVDSKLQKSMEDLAGAVESMGDGMDSISRVAGNLDDLEKVVFRNNINLEKNTEEYKNNSKGLNDLANKIS